MEAGLKKLEAQEQKYSAELDKVLAEYAELKAQATNFDPVELHEARLAICEEIERSAVNQVRAAYGKKYNPLMLLESKHDMSRLLHEEADSRSIHERLRQKQQVQTQVQQQKQKGQER